MSTRRPASYIPADSRLTFIKDLGMKEAASGNIASRKRYALYKCSCGNTKEIQISHVKAGKIQSCGCKPSNIHGLSRHPIYSAWKSIRARCYNDKHKSYHRYGGRGIIMCKEWRDDPAPFIQWAQDNGWTQGMDIHRSDNNLPYSPDNCILLTHSDHMRLHGYDNVKNLGAYAA